jgi:prepilin-type N-terminal cleavage/methylation domain-containing protein
MKTNTSPHHNRKGFTLMELLVVITIIVTLAGIATPQIAKHLRTKDRIVALSNARQLGFGLRDFEEEYGSLPDRETARAVVERTESKLSLTGDTANDYLRQLLAAGIVKSEEPFWAPTATSKRRPDNVFEGTDALRPGEVGFAYILNGTGAMPTDNPNHYVAVTPVTNAAKGEFDSHTYLDKAVALSVDGSVTLLDIRPETGKVHVAKGRTLLETGSGTRWGNDVHPVLKAPKTK